MEQNILVAKINKNDEIILKQFYDFLKNENIEYKEKLEEEWKGIREPKYIAKINFFVNKKDELKVKKFIEDFENANIQSEEYNELKKYRKEEMQNQDEETKKYEKRHKNLWRIMIYGILCIVIACLIISVISN